MKAEVGENLFVLGRVVEKKDIVDSIKNTIANNLLIRVIGDKEKVSCGYLMDQELPAFLKKFIEGHSLKLVHHEKPIRYSFTEHFDFKDQKVQDSFEQLFVSILASTQFAKSEISRLFSTSINLQMDLLLMPRQTLERVFYQKAEQISKRKLIHALEILGSHWQYLMQLIQAIQSYENDPVAKLGFSFLARRAEEELYLNERCQSLLDECEELGNLIQVAGPPHDRGIPGELLRRFFDSRGRKELSERIANRYPQNESIWSFAEIRALFKSFGFESSHGKNADEAIDPASGVEAEAARKETKILMVEEDLTNFSVNKAEIEKQPPGPYPAMLTLVSPKDQRCLLKKIFNDDYYAYDDFMSKVDATVRWKDAKAILDQLFIQRALDPYSREAMRLGDLVFSRYFSK